MPELSDKELRFGYWYFLHRGSLRRVAIGLFILGLAGLWSYAGYQLVDWLATSKADEESTRLLVASTVNTQDYLKRHAPIPLEVGTATAVPAGKGVYDLVAEVKNPNPAWGVKQMNYTFTVSDQTFTGTSFFLPLENKYLLNLGTKLPSSPGQVSLVVADVQWDRIRDLAAFTTPSFSVTKQKLEQLSPLTPGQPSASKLHFDLKNDSVLNFWQVVVVAVLMNGESPQAVGRQLVNNVASQGTYPVEFYWPNGVPPTDHLVVKPEVNVLDPTVIKATE